MPDTRFDIVAIGNAIVDVIAKADDAFIAREGVPKGSMRLIDPATADALYGRMGPGVETSGGSAANTLAGMALLGARCAFVGQVADDQLGAVFTHDIRAHGVTFDTPPRAGHPPTGRVLILVTPDAQRTMNTSLGASEYLPMSAIDEAVIAGSAILYLEGYMWGPPEPREAMRRAIAIARAAGRKVAFTLSDAFCIERHRTDFLELIDGGEIDLLFANEAEILSLAEVSDFEAAVAAIGPRVPLLVVTRGADGAIALRGSERFGACAEPVDRIVDTTGAGDLFAAGFLAGQIQRRSIAQSLVMGGVAAAEVISHYGARPDSELAAMIAARLRLDESAPSTRKAVTPPA